MVGAALSYTRGPAPHTTEAEPASVFASPASVVAAGAIPSPVAGAPRAPPGLAEAFWARGRGLWGKVGTALGGRKDAAALGFTVAVDARLVPDYYTIVKNPIHLGEIRNRLRKSTYPSAVEFYNVSSIMSWWWIDEGLGGGKRNRCEGQGNLMVPKPALPSLNSAPPPLHAGHAPAV